MNQDEGPWIEWWEEKVRNQNAKGPGAQLARLLSRYGISPKSVRIGSDVKKGYELADFKDAFSRYLPSRLKEVSEVTTEQEGTPDASPRLRSDGDPVGELLSENACNLVPSLGPQGEGKANGEGVREADGTAKGSLVDLMRQEIEAGGDDIDEDWDAFWNR